MTDDSFPPFPFANLDASAPPMPKEKKARKVKEAKATNGRRKRKGKRRFFGSARVTASPETNPAPRSVPVAKVAHDDLLSVSKDDIWFINGVLEGLKVFPRKQQERIIVALSKVFG